MMSSFFGSDFSTAVGVVVWCLLPLYGCFLGLALPLLSKAANSSTPSQGYEDVGALKVYQIQLFLFVGVISAMASYRGYAG